MSSETRGVDPAAPGGARRSGGREPRLARLADRLDLTPALAVFRLEPEGGVPPFEPGQFVPLGLRLEGGRPLWRPYSIASPPEEQRHLELYVRLVRLPAERPHLTAELWRLRPGAPVLWKPPRGRFTIADQHPDGSPDGRRLLLLSAGTGLAPFVSCVLHRRAAGDPRPVVLCHGARYAEELGYRELLSGLERELGPARFRYVPTLSRPGEERNAGWTGQVGRVESLLVRPEEGGPSRLEHVLGERLDPRSHCAYVCGFGGTVSAVVDALTPLGFRTRERPRPDGSYDVRCESYG